MLKKNNEHKFHLTTHFILETIAKMAIWNICNSSEMLQFTFSIQKPFWTISNRLCCSCTNCPFWNILSGFALALILCGSPVSLLHITFNLHLKAFRLFGCYAWITMQNLHCSHTHMQNEFYTNVSPMNSMCIIHNQEVD